MRFGHFFYPMKFDDSQDDREIQDCLDEAELVEALGFDAIWFAEHYFTGECVYGDPLVFASAVAVKTSRVTLGFGIIELPLHNPVRVAMQTALLDNLSGGRLVVGTAKGSNYNAFEYLGFGTDPAQGAEQMEEAEELLVRAWTTDNVDFRGGLLQRFVPVGATAALPETASAARPGVHQPGIDNGDGPTGPADPAAGTFDQQHGGGYSALPGHDGGIGV